MVNSSDVPFNIFGSGEALAADLTNTFLHFRMCALIPARFFITQRHVVIATKVGDFGKNNCAI